MPRYLIRGVCEYKLSFESIENYRIAIKQSAFVGWCVAKGMQRQQL